MKTSNRPTQSYTVDDAGLTMRIYRSLLSLDSLPNDTVFHCPYDVGSSYDMDFYEQKQDVLNVKADASGCQFVHRDEGSGLRSDDAFWQLVIEADQTYG